MDTVPAIRCENCGSHQAGPTPCTGVCLNKTWQPRSDATRYVRDWELACYGGWGRNLWEPRSGATPPGGAAGPGPGTGGPGGGGKFNPYGTLIGSAVVPLIPIELLTDLEAGVELDPDPRDLVLAD